MQTIEILQLGSYPRPDETALAAIYRMHRYFEASDKPAFLAGVAGSVRGLVTRGDIGAAREVIDALPGLEIIGIYGVGFDAVDLDACRARGIRVTNTPDVLTGDVADLAVAMALVRARDMAGAQAWVTTGSWAARGSFAVQRRFHGRRAGILGLGRIGLAVAQRLAGFGMDIAYCTATGPKADAAAWHFVADPVALAARSDFLFVTLAASAATRHIVNRPVIAALGPQGMLINVSRGSNVDEDALLDALESGALGFAALDVFEGEPAVNPRFLTLPNVLLQPHIGSNTDMTRRAMGELLRDNLAAHFSGAPLPTPVV